MIRVMAAVAIGAAILVSHANAEDYWSARVGKFHMDLPPKYAQQVEAYCSWHPKDPDCAASGFHPTTSDPIEQAVDKRLADHKCEDLNDYYVYCVSPWKIFAEHPDWK